MEILYFLAALFLIGFGFVSVVDPERVIEWQSRWRYKYHEATDFYRIWVRIFGVFEIVVSVAYIVLLFTV